MITIPVMPVVVFIFVVGSLFGLKRAWSFVEKRKSTLHWNDLAAESARCIQARTEIINNTLVAAVKRIDELEQSIEASFLQVEKSTSTFEAATINRVLKLEQKLIDKGLLTAVERIGKLEKSAVSKEELYVFEKGLNKLKNTRTSLDLLQEQTDYLQDDQDKTHHKATATEQKLERNYKVLLVSDERIKKLEQLAFIRPEEESWPRMTDYANGKQEWKNKKGEFHREDGPAIIWPDGIKTWMQDGKRHRTDGPAFVCAHDSHNGYWIRGKELTEEEFYKHPDCEIRIKAPKPEDSWPRLTVDKNGNKFWLNEQGQRHREDGPAAVWINGEEHWIINGLLHREDGPAVKFTNGDRWWYQNHKCHRVDGPAVEHANGSSEYWINGLDLTEEEFYKHPDCQVKIKGPEPKESWPRLTLSKDGTETWTNKEGQLHRENGPALDVIGGTRGGYKGWYINNHHSRLDGPARKWKDGQKEYWINNVHLSEEEFYNHPDCQVKIKGPEPEESWPRLTVDENGNKEWLNKEGKQHREGGPAIELANGNKSWYINGQRHRLDGPARQWAADPSLKEYWIDDKILTVEEFNNHPKSTHWPKMAVNHLGTKTWRNKEGKWHRENGPAIERRNGDKHWYQNDKLHRLDGPAIEDNGFKGWWINDEYFTEEEFYKHPDCQIKRPEPEVWPRLGVNLAGSKIWRNENGQYHRTDGPALECHNGAKEWYIEGTHHRVGGPAIEYADGTKVWFQNGNKHRVDGAAVELHDGRRRYYIAGELLTEEEFYKHPDCEAWPLLTIGSDGNKEWINKEGKWHREPGEGPSREFLDPNGIKVQEWHKNGKPHRLDGPSMIVDGKPAQWWIDGKHLTEEDWQNHPDSTHWPKMETTESGTLIWKNKEGQYHNDDGPAIIFPSDQGGLKRWFVNGKHHRIDGPSCEDRDGGALAYYIEDKILSKPDFENHPKSTHWPKMKIDTAGDKSWKNKEGQSHRLDGPAFEHANGFKSWYVNDKRHRLDGPAMEWPEDQEERCKPANEYWIDDERLTEQQFYNHPDCQIKRPEESWPKMTVNEDVGQWPDMNGAKEWRNAKGKRHRTDGPAIEHANGEKRWYIDGEYLSEEEFYKHPDCEAWPQLTVDGYGGRNWKNKEGQYHREDGPAYEGPAYIEGRVSRGHIGYRSWFINGMRHRLDGFAREWDNNQYADFVGKNEYWIDNEKLTEKEFHMHPKRILFKDVQTERHLA